MVCLSSQKVTTLHGTIKTERIWYVNVQLCGVAIRPMRFHSVSPKKTDILYQWSLCHFAWFRHSVEIMQNSDYTKLNPCTVQEILHLIWCPWYKIISLLKSACKSLIKLYYHQIILSTCFFHLTHIFYFFLERIVHMPRKSLYPVWANSVSFSPMQMH